MHKLNICAYVVHPLAFAPYPLYARVKSRKCPNCWKSLDFRVKYWPYPELEMKSIITVWESVRCCTYISHGGCMYFHEYEGKWVGSCHWCLANFWCQLRKKTSIFDYNSDNQIKNISIIGDYKPNETWEEVFSNKLLVVIQIIRLKLQNLFLNEICNYIAWMALLDEK